MPAFRPPRGRDGALDAFRGACVLSMTFGHLASGTLLSRPLHAFQWVDAAAGFIVTSGLVLGITTRSAFDRGAAMAEQSRALLRRAAVIYAVHVVLVVYAVLLATALPDRLEERRYPRLGVDGVDVRTLVTEVPTLQLLPSHMPILPLYVVLLVVSVGAVALLRRRHGGRWVLGLAATCWLLSQRWPDALITAPTMNFRPALWALPFFAALTLGWHWHRLALWDRRERQVAVVAVAVVLTLAGTLLANLVQLTDVLPAGAERGLERAIGDKYAVPAGALVFMAAAAAACYAGLVLLRRVRLVARVLTPLQETGARSLDAYVVLSFATPVVLAVCRGRPLAAQLAALVVFGGCWAYARARARRAASVRTPAAV